MSELKDIPKVRKKNLRVMFKGDKKAQKRFWAVRQIAHSGWNQHKAARELQLPQSSINRWLQTFCETGDINCFREKKRGPKKASKVNEDVLKVVINAKRENPERGGETIYRLVINKVYVSLRNVYRILKGYKEGKYNHVIETIDAVIIEDDIIYTGFGGSFLLSYYYDRFELPQMFGELGLDNRESKLLLYYLHGNLMGFEHVHQLYHLDDEGLFLANGLRERPHSDYVHKALGKLGENFTEFQNKQMALLQTSYLLKLERISIDPHFIGYLGEKKEVAKNWDAVRRFMRPGWRPLYAYDLDVGSCFYALWVKGNYRGYHKLKEIIGGVKRALINDNKLKEVYLDREFYCFSDLRELVEQERLDFTIPARNSKKMFKWLDKIDRRRCGYYTDSRGKKVGVGLWEIGPGEYNPKYPYKLTLIGFEEKRDKGIKRYGYLSSIPKDRYPPTKFGKLAKRRWRHENYFREVVHQSSHNQLPSSEDLRIMGHLAVEMLGHNVIQLLKRDLPRKSKLKRAEIKTLRVKLFQKVARVIKGNSRILIHFPKKFLESRVIEPIEKKYGMYPLKLFNDRLVSFKY